MDFPNGPIHITDKDLIKQTTINKHLLQTFKSNEMHVYELWGPSFLSVACHPDGALVIFYSWLQASRQEGNEQLVVSEWCFLSCCEPCALCESLSVCLWERATEPERDRETEMREMREAFSSELWYLASVICRVKFCSQTLAKGF